MKTTEFFDEHNPFARQSMSGRMLEATRKGLWKADEKTKQELAKIYVENVAKNGVSCSYTTCDHPELQQFIKGVALTNSSIKATDVTKWISKVENATNKTLDEAMAKRKIEKQQALDPNYKMPNDNTQQANNKPMPGKVQKQMTKVQGYKMEEEKVIKNELTQANPPQTPWLVYLLIIGFQFISFLFGGLKRYF